MHPSAVRLLGVCAIVALALSACARKEPGQAVQEEVGPGRLEGRTWAHDYFGVTLSVPDDWHIFSEEEKQQISSTGTDLLAGDDQNLRRQLEAAAPRTLTLLGISRHPLGTPVLFNPNLVIIAERIGGMPGIRSGSDYLNLMQQSIGRSQIQMTFDPVEPNARIGPITADRISSSMQMGPMQIRQRIYAALKGDYALVFTLSYVDEEQLDALETLCSSIQGL